MSVLIALSICTWKQASCWSDSAVLARHALEIDKDNWGAHGLLGTDALKKGRNAEAESHFRRVLLLRRSPDPRDGNRAARYNLGVALGNLGKNSEAIACYEEVLGFRPDFTMARYNLAGTLLAAGRPREAVERYSEILAAAPDHAGALNNLAWIYATAADPEVRRPEEALRLARLGVLLSRNPVSLDTLARPALRRGSGRKRWRPSSRRSRSPRPTRTIT